MVARPTPSQERAFPNQDLGPARGWLSWHTRQYVGIPVHTYTYVGLGVAKRGRAPRRAGLNHSSGRRTGAPGYIGAPLAEGRYGEITMVRPPVAPAAIDAIRLLGVIKSQVWPRTK